MKKLTISSGVFGSSALNLSACFVRAHWPKVSSRYFIIFSDSTKTENMVEIIILHGVIRTARTSMKLHARPSSDFNFNQTFISPSSINSKIGTFLSTFKSDIQIGLFERLMLMVSCALVPLKICIITLWINVYVFVAQKWRFQMKSYVIFTKNQFYAFDKWTKSISIKSFKSVKLENLYYDS